MTSPDAARAEALRQAVAIAGQWSCGCCPECEASACQHFVHYLADKLASPPVQADRAIWWQKFLERPVQAEAGAAAVRWPQFTLCRDTGVKAESGRCPLHGGDACLEEFVPMAPPAATPDAREGVPPKVAAAFFHAVDRDHAVSAGCDGCLDIKEVYKALCAPRPR